MRNLNEDAEYEVPFVGPELKCPACEDFIPIIATVEVKKGEVRHVGSTGFREPMYSVSISTNIKRFTIQHECKPKPGGDTYGA